MSRLGYINRELNAAAEEDRTPSLSEADVKWAVEWERWDLLEAAGYNVAELQAGAGVEPTPEQADPYNTSGVPGGGANDRESRLNPDTGQPETVMEDGDEEEEYAAYEDMRVDDLRAELQRRQLPADGRKAELVERLEADDAAQESEEDDEEQG